ISRSRLHRHLENKVLRRFISRVKPALTDDHKLQWLTWALDQVQRGKFVYCFQLFLFTFNKKSERGILCYFDAVFDVVHIYENGSTCTRLLADTICLPMNHNLTGHVRIDDILVKSCLLWLWLDQVTTLVTCGANKGTEVLQKSPCRNANHQKY
ncbi:Transposase, partial [Phytophthora megakarya]